MATVATGPLLALAVGDRRLGVPARTVREVARMPRLTPVPLAPAAMLGMANVRGTVLPVLSLAALTGRAAGSERRLVVLDGAEQVGLAVDAVAELLEADHAKAASVEPIDALALVGHMAAGMERQVRSRAAAESAAAVQVTTAAVSLITFAIGSQSFALPLDAVEEVLRLPSGIAAVPHAQPGVIGSVEFRGAVLPLLGLAELLALPGDARSSRTRVLVARIGAHRVGLVVDAVRAIVRVAERDIDPVPLVLTRGKAEARIQAICRLGGGKLVSLLAPEHLVRDDITAQLIGSSPVHDFVAACSDDGSQQFVVFRVGGASFGLPIVAVERVAMVPARLSRLPRSPAFVCGVMPFQGQAIPLIDQARRFGAVMRSGAKQRVLVVKLGTQRAGFLVDAVAGIRRARDADLHRLPRMSEHGERIFGSAAPDGEGGLVLMLDPSDLLDRAEHDVLQAMTVNGPGS